MLEPDRAGHQRNGCKARRRRAFIVVLLVARLLLFPLIDGNGGDLDAAANARTFASWRSA